MVETARVARVAVVLLVGELAGADVELGRVDHDHVVAGVDVGRPDRLVLPAQQGGRLGGDLAQHLALGVDHVPGAVDVSGFRGERAQRILTKNCGGVDCRPASDAKGQSSPRAGRAAIGASGAGRPGRYSPRRLRVDTGVPHELHRPQAGFHGPVAAPHAPARAVTLVAGVAAACASFPPAEPGGPGLQSVDNWVSGRNKIWDLAFPTNGQPPLFTENDSGVIFARWSGDERARPLGAVTQFDGAFDPTGEGGLMGIALAPGFDGAGNRRAFVCYSTTSDNRVARFDVELRGRGLRGALQLDADRDRPPALRASTTAAGCASSPARARCSSAPATAPPPPGRSRRPCWPARPSASTRTATRGRATSRARVWYTRGHRNPQGIAFRPGSNDPYSIEHGPDVNDEVNKLVNGANSGWNPNNGSGGYDQSKPMTDTTIEPANTMTPVWQSGGVTVAPSGGTFLSGAQWKNWTARSSSRASTAAPPWGSACSSCTSTPRAPPSPGRPSPRSIAVCACAPRCRAPTAALYVVTDGGSGTGAIWRVTPT